VISENILAYTHLFLFRTALYTQFATACMASLILYLQHYVPAISHQDY
jgi:hypothetical protein